MRLFKSPRGLLLSLVAVCLLALQFPVTGAAQSKGTGEIINGVRDTGQFLPNSTLLAKVQDRKIDVLAFRTHFFQSDPRYRPKIDSAGRAEFLTNMIRKDVLGLTALSSGLTLGFEDRAELRQHTATLVSNRLFETSVLNVPNVSQDSLRKVYELLRYDVKARVLNFGERSEAVAAREALVKRKATWEALAAKSVLPGQPKPNTQGAWVEFQKAPLGVALQVWPLKPGAISDVVTGSAGYQLVQVLERRPHSVPMFEAMSSTIQSALTTHTSRARRVALLQEAKAELKGIRYDSTNVKWAARQYFVAVQADTTNGGKGGIVIDENVPHFERADTSRTLVSWDGGRVSLGQLATVYEGVQAAMRPTINTPEGLMDYADLIMLEPHLLDLAYKRGLDKDPAVIRAVELKREEMLVTRMVEDSCFARIVVSPKERSDYYQKNRNLYVTWASVHAAFVVRDTKEEAESVRARLVAGEKIAAILRADSLAGNVRSGTKRMTTETHDPFNKILFEEMRPGQSRVVGPDKTKSFACVYLIDFDPGRQLPLKEVEEMVDESLRNIKAEQALNAFVDRHSKRFAVEAHYDRLMSVRLTVPRDDEGE